MSRLASLRRRPSSSSSRTTPSSRTLERGLAEYLAAVGQFTFGGSTYGLGFSWASSSSTAEVATGMAGYVSALASCPPAFAAQLVRGELLSQVELEWRGKRGTPNAGRTVDGNLGPLERFIREGGLERAEWHAGVAGNAYVYRNRARGRLQLLRPDFVTIISGSNADPEAGGWALDADLLGYIYKPHGGRAVTLLPEDVAHWAPIPDPLAVHRGMSWLTPVLREIQGDSLSTEHKLKFFENAGTPNLVFSLAKEVTPEQLRDFKKATDEVTAGVENAYRNLYLGGGADVTVVGASLQQLEFAATQAAGENRIAVASRVPAAILGVKEGLQGSTLNAGNFGQARRLLADTWLYSALRGLCQTLERLVPTPAGARLWYDPNLPFLREDAKDAADIARLQSMAIRQYVDGGFDPDTAVAAVRASDLSLLKHTGRLSVQLQAPKDGEDAPADDELVDDPDAELEPDPSDPADPATP